MEPVQLLTPEGTFTAHPDYPVDASAERCRSLLRHMTLARRLDQEALALQRQGELGLWLQCWGQEAAQVGSMAALEATDWVFPSYRDHAAALYRGIGPAELLSQWRGCTASGWDPFQHRFHVYTLVLAAQLLHATGFAMGGLLEGGDDIVLTYFGDGASSEGDANEALNWAASFNAPVVFFCQNNQWAISTPAADQTGAPVHQRAAGYGLDTYVVDGNDVLAVAAVTERAVARVRGGGGPAFIEAMTYRMGGHSTSDNPSAYRDSAEVDAWAERDPIDRLRTFMLAEGMIDDAALGVLGDEAEHLAADTRRECLTLAPMPLAEVFDHVLPEGSRPLVQERDAMLSYLDSFEDERVAG